MKKYLLTIILFILIIPTVVFAASTCNPSDIEIKSITLSKLVGNSEEVTQATVNNKNIDIDVKLYDPNDYVEYTILVKNKGRDEYFIKEEDLEEGQFLDYEFVHENDSYKIEPGEEKEITLRVKYKERVEGNANYVSTDSLSLNIIDNQTVKVTNTLKNVSVAVIGLIILVLASIIIGGGVLINNKKMNLLILLICLAILIPINTDASCDATIDVDVKVELDSKNAIFKAGPDFNMQIKTLAGTTIGDNGPYTSNDTILAFKKSTTEPPQANKNIASADNSPLPIYVWFDNGTIYWWSEDDTPSLGENGSFFLAGLNNATDISGAATIDASNATTLDDLFPMCSELVDLSPISNWNTSNNTNLTYSFYGVKATNLDALSKWDVSKVTTMIQTFGYTHNLTNIDGISNWDTSSVKNMTSTFYQTAITNVDSLSKWDVSNVEVFSGIFYNIPSLIDITGISNWNTANAIYMDRIFDYCTNLPSLEGLEKWDVSNVTTLLWAFAEIKEVTTLAPIKSWNTSSMEVLQGTFAGMTGLVTIDLSGWDTGNVTTMENMFYDDNNINSLEGIRNFDTAKVTNMRFMFFQVNGVSTTEPIKNWNVTSLQTAEATFYGMEGLTTLDLSGWVTSSLTDISYMFNRSSNITSYEGISNFDTSKVTTMKYTFCMNNAITTLEPIKNWTVTSLQNLEGTFYYMSALQDANLSGWNTSNVTNMSYLFEGCASLSTIEGLRNWNLVKVSTTREMFAGCANIATLEPIEHWNVSTVKNAYGMFTGLTKITSADFSNWNVSKVEDMAWFIGECNELLTINITGWTTTSLKYMYSMFRDNPKLHTITGLGNINTSKVTYINNMFGGDTSITSLDLHNWDTTKLEGMTEAFHGCTNLTSLNLVGWDTSNLTKMSSAFRNTGLTTLDLSTFNTKKVTEFVHTFNSPGFETIYIGENWDTSANTGDTTYVFASTAHLPNFSTSNENYRSLAWAKPSTEGGYLTLKTND